MSTHPDRRGHPRVELFPEWQERDIHRVWLFHKQQPGTLFGLLVDLSVAGGQMILRERDALPRTFCLSVLDQRGKAVQVFSLQVTELWKQPYLHGMVKIGFRCDAVAPELADHLVELAQVLSSNHTAFLLTRIEPL